MKSSLQEYALTATQKGMLFNSLSAPQSGVDIEQILFDLRERLDVQKLENAWDILLRKYEVLRAGFSWDAAANVKQSFPLDIRMPLITDDWTHLQAHERDAAIDKLLTDDRKIDFDFNQPPLMRFHLIKLAEDHFYCLWTFHHILLDGRSFPIVISELFAIYDSEQDPQPPTAKYSDFLVWQAALDQEPSRRYWREQMQGLDGPTELPVVGQGIGDADQSVAAIETTIDQALRESLTHIVTETGVTLNTLIQTAWAVLLAKYSGKNDVVFGTTRACRHNTVKESENIVGLLINTLPFRIKLNNNESLIDLYQQVRATTVAMREFEHHPLQEIQGYVTGTGDKGLFDTLVVFERYLLNDKMKSLVDNWQGRSCEYRGQTNFPITLLVYDGLEVLVRLEYQQDYLSELEASRMLERFVNILGQFTKPNINKLTDVSLLSQEQYEEIKKWNDTSYNYDFSGCLHTLIERQVELTPDGNALRFDGRALTYRQLDDYANALAFDLIEMGVTPESIVAVQMERSLELVIALYAILKAGGAYLPLAVDYPQNRSEIILKESKASVLLTLVDGETDRQGEGHWGIKRFSVDLSLLKPTASKPNVSVEPSNLAYVIYTSGSTGMPKGVMNEHGGICNRLLWMQKVYKLTADDKVVQKTPYTFDVSVWEFFWPLMTGAELVVAKPGGHQDTEYLINLINEHNITTLHFVPSMLAIFLGDKNSSTCHSLKRVICSGEALTKALQDKFFSLLSAGLHNLYGPTEAAVDVTYWHCEQNSAMATVPIGYPVDNTQIHILDQFGAPVPVGIPGELFIGGVQVARGYLNREDLTRERFIDHPFSNVPNRKLYKTGDVARYLEGGAIEYIGRNDFQVKLNGLRIELNEIENVLLAHNSVKEAVVIVREDRADDKRIVAYYTGESNLDTDTLKEHLAQQLPVYMVPHHFVQMQALPLTESGKVNRKALPKPTLDIAATDGTYVAPATEAEKVLQTIWEKAFGVEKPSVATQFSDLGGNSMLLLKIFKLIQDSTSYTISIPQLFQHSTIKALAHYLENQNNQPANDQAVTDRASKQKAARARKKKFMKG